MIPGRNTHFMSWVMLSVLALLMCKTEKTRGEKREEKRWRHVHLSSSSDQQAPLAAEPTSRDLK